MLLDDSASASQEDNKLSVVPANTVRNYFVGSLFGSRKKTNGAMKTGLLGSNSRTATPTTMEGKHSRFAVLGRLFKPWKWKRKKKSDKFEQTSRTLERKISMRSTKEELIKKGVLLPESGEKDPQNSPKLNNSCQDNHIPQANGSVCPVDDATDIMNNSTSPSSSYFCNSVVVTSSQNITILNSFSQSNDLSLPVIHNVSFPNLPDVEEVPSQSGEILLSALPEPPISVNEIGPIPPPPMFSNPSPVLASKFQVQSDEMEECSPSALSPCSQFVMYLPQRDPTINTSKVEEIPAKEPHPMNAMPKKSALKKKGVLSPLVHNLHQLEATLQQSINDRETKADSRQQDESESRPLPMISLNETEVSDSDSESENPILWRDYYGDDEECWQAAKVARKDSLAMKLAQRPDIQELIDKNIYIAQSERERQETREDVGKKLIRRLSLRPSPEELEQRNILKFQTAEELEKEKEQRKKTLIRKLSFRPTIAELKERQIIRFNDYVEVTQAQDYDRRGDKPWTRLTPRDKAAIRKELNEFKSTEMEVHVESRHLTRFHRP